MARGVIEEDGLHCGALQSLVENPRVVVARGAHRLRRPRRSCPTTAERESEPDRGHVSAPLAASFEGLSGSVHAMMAYSQRR